MRLSWANTIRPENSSQRFRALPYTCGYCGYSVASGDGFYAMQLGKPSGSDKGGQISICPHCTNPTYLSADGDQVPGSAFGSPVGDVPDEVNELYEEARDCMKVNAYTAAVMCCRKLLMNIAVARGAKKNLKFYEYVNYLSDQGFVPPDGKEWVDVIRQKGNEATHEIALMEREDAEDLITFSEMLLRFIYEYPAMMKARANKGQANQVLEIPPTTPQGR